MEEAIAKADVLIEAAHWIREFRGKITVIKLGGSVLETPAALTHLLLDIVFMETVGVRPVLIHGGGAAVSRAMTAAGLTPRFVQGRRYTDADTLRIVEQVLAYEINESLAGEINSLGGCAKPLNFRTENLLYGEPIKLNGKNGESVDLGFVGRVTRVQCETITNLCSQGIVPVIPSMCITDDGQKLNVNADTVATAVAQALHAEKLVFLSDVNGVRRNKDDADTLVHSLTDQESQEMIESGQVDAGMIPKLQACIDTLHHGVRKIHIIDGRLRHSLLLEVYTSRGVGTEIVSRQRAEGRG